MIFYFHRDFLDCPDILLMTTGPELQYLDVWLAADFVVTVAAAAAAGAGAGDDWRLDAVMRGSLGVVLPLTLVREWMSSWSVFVLGAEAGNRRRRQQVFVAEVSL